MLCGVMLNRIYPRGWDILDTVFCSFGISFNNIVRKTGFSSQTVSNNIRLLRDWNLVYEMPIPGGKLLFPELNTSWSRSVFALIENYKLENYENRFTVQKISDFFEDLDILDYILIYPHRSTLSVLDGIAVHDTNKDEVFFEELERQVKSSLNVDLRLIIMHKDQFVSFGAARDGFIRSIIGEHLVVHGIDNFLKAYAEILKSLRSFF